LTYLPIGLFGVQIATAVRPAVARRAASHDLDGIRDTVSRGISLMLMLNVPATLGLITLAPPIVRLLFEHGRFEPADTAPTAAALRFYAVGLIGYSTARIASPTFYALRESKIPVAVSMGSIALNVVLSTALVEVMGFRGLALGTALAALFDGGLLMFLLHRRLNGIGGAHLAAVVAKVTLAGLAMAAATMGAERILSGIVVGPSLERQALRLTLEIGTGLAVLAIFAKVLRISEFADPLQLPPSP